MTEYILVVPIEEIELFIARLGVEDSSIYGCKVVGEIIRCKDCIHQDEFKYCDRLGFTVGNNGYCAWGERW